ncbi:hypothetical protein ACFE04_005072 [Oxalis oulophora]
MALSLLFVTWSTEEMSSIVVMGLNVHTAPVEMHKKLAKPQAEWPRAIEELCSLNHIEEAAASGISVSKICLHQFLLYDKGAKSSPRTALRAVSVSSAAVELALVELPNLHTPMQEY